MRYKSCITRAEIRTEGKVMLTAYMLCILDEALFSLMSVLANLLEMS